MPEPRRPLSFVAAAVWTTGVALLLQIALGLTEGARPGAIGDLVNVTLCHVLSFSIAVFAMLRVYEPETPVREVVAFRRPPFGLLVLGPLVGAGIYPALNVVDNFVTRRMPPSSEELELFGRLLEAPTAARRVFLALSFLAIIPITEELFFRGVVFSGLRRTRRASEVILGTALFFSIARGDPRSFASMAVFGALLGWLRERSRSIIPSIAAQAAFFAVPMVPILRGADPLAEEHYPRAWVWGGLAVVVVTLAVVELWRRRAGDEEEEDPVV